MANQTDKLASWTIKAMPVHVRETAVRHAKMEGMTMAEWIGRAVETEANRQAGKVVIPPRPAPTLESALAEIDRGFAVARMATDALQAMAAAQSSGLPVSKAAAKDAVRVVRAEVRDAGGLPVLKGRQTKGQTNRQNGQTISLDQAPASREFGAG